MDVTTDSEEEAIILAALAEEDDQRKRKRRRIWIHEINLSREEEGEFHSLYKKLREHEERFYLYFRMDLECFDQILHAVRHDITKDFTKYRRPIGPTERLAVALRYLATGDSYSTIGHSFRMGFSTVSKIVKEVCQAIWKHLQPVYMAEPTVQTWEDSIRGFLDKWQFPNCIGSIDGKHVTIKCPKKSGSNYFCYLQKFSIVLLAIVDYNYKFICIDVGGYGRNSDGGIFEASAMGQKLANGTLKVPQDRPLPGQEQSTSCVIIGDEAFPLLSYLMRPFPYRQSKTDERKNIFNKRLCRARRVVENAFGILSQKWRILNRPIDVKVETAIDIIKATCVLHNYLRSKNCDEFLGHLLDNENPTMEAIQNLANDGRRPTNYSFQIRDRFVDYFNM